MKKWIYVALAAIAPWYAAYPFDPPDFNSGVPMVMVIVAIYPTALVLAPLVGAAGKRLICFLIVLLGYPIAMLQAYFAAGEWVTTKRPEDLGIGAAFFVAASILFGLIALGILKIFNKPVAATQKTIS